MNKKQYLHCDFIVDDNRLIFFSYENFLLEFNLNDYKMQFSEFADTAICGEIAYRDSIERFIRIKEMLIAVSVSGKKIYLYDIDAKRWRTIQIECNQCRYGNYIDIAYDDKCVYVIPKYRPYILKVDVQKQSINKIEAPFLLQLSNQGTSVCMKHNALYFFESNSKRIVVFCLDAGKYMEMEIEYMSGNVASVQYIKGIFLILFSDGHLVKWAEESRRMELFINPVEEFGDNYFLEFAVTEKNIWLLPMLGGGIYIYDIQDGTIKKYSGYPQQFSYLGSKGRYKFLKGQEYKNRIYFGMHSANHFLVIDKKTGIAEWMKPVFPAEKDEYLFRIKHGLNPAEKEGTVSLEMVLETIIKLNRYLPDEDKNNHIRVNPCIGELIYTKVSGIC